MPGTPEDEIDETPVPDPEPVPAYERDLPGDGLIGIL